MPNAAYPEKTLRRNQLLVQLVFHSYTQLVALSIFHVRTVGRSPPEFLSSGFALPGHGSSYFGVYHYETLLL